MIISRNVRQKNSKSFQLTEHSLFSTEDYDCNTDKAQVTRLKKERDYGLLFLFCNCKWQVIRQKISNWNFGSIIELLVVSKSVQNFNNNECHLRF